MVPRDTPRVGTGAVWTWCGGACAVRVVLHDEYSDSFALSWFIVDPSHETQLFMEP